MTPAESKYLSSLVAHVACGDGAAMSIPQGDLEWQLRYGNPEFPGTLRQVLLSRTNISSASTSPRMRLCVD